MNAADEVNSKLLTLRAFKPSTGWVLVFLPSSAARSTDYDTVVTVGSGASYAAA